MIYDQFIGAKMAGTRHAVRGGMMSSSKARVASTVLDLARALVRLEIEHPHSVLSGHYRTASFVWFGVARRYRKHHPEAGPGEIETALEYLASKGLVDRSHDEWEVSARRPQRYRWSRLATPESLARFADEAVRCAGPDCRVKVKGYRYCSERCHGRAIHLAEQMGGTA